MARSEPDTSGGCLLSGSISTSGTSGRRASVLRADALRAGTRAWGPPAMFMFLFLVVALVVVVAAVTVSVVGGGESTPLPDAEPERLHDPLPYDRPVSRGDVDAVRFP